MTGDVMGQTLVKLFQGPRDGEEFISGQSLPPTLHFCHQTGEEVSVAELLTPVPESPFTVSYHLVHVEPAHTILPAEAHYLYEVPR